MEDVLIGCGYSEAYTWSLVGRDPRPDARRLPEPLSAEHAILRTTLLEGLVAAAAHNQDEGNEEIALFEIARVYLPTTEQLPEERWRLGGIARGGYFRAKGTVETVHAALKLEPAFERAREPFLHPGKGCPRGCRLGRRAPSDAPRGLVGDLRARPGHALRRRARADPLRGRHHLSGCSPGSRVRRRRGAAGRGARSGGSRTAQAPSYARRGSSTSTAAVRSPQARSRLPSALRSSRLSGRCPTRTRR